jgi:hypothetical protein
MNIIKTIILLLLCIAGIHCSTANRNDKDIFSAKSKQLYNELLQITNGDDNKDINKLITKELISKYGLIQIENDYFVRATLKVNEKLDPEDLTEKEIRLFTKADKIMTSEIPLRSYLVINKIEGIDYIEINSPIRIRK